ncbi:FAD-binding domain-containing protein [Pararhodobacter zhoushanensis]|uniref:Deoxyribodipyrimidine photo-lyase n=1 Tax=Pararhodobacter zhoushanensis TaxID=2479545 RepID=A0ABT3GT55_9RHOB|nr:FAD-binding domain-containing protein [Pararhodobacter zhoushanensis]MCW1930701.1 deoxyribodipyrimidine photo-lyase [Pararhodobacter zhoushanensis]
MPSQDSALTMLSLVWFTRDLRVQDHPALSLAAAGGRVLPVWIADPAEWARPEVSARHWGFLDDCLRGLRADLAELGQPLILRTGDPVEVLTRLQAKHGFLRLITHQETGSAWARARQQRVADWARGAGVEWVALAQGDGPVLPAPPLPMVVEGTGALPGLKALGLAEDRCPYRQPGGRAAGLQLLESYLSVRGQGYSPATATALGAERAGSRLSPYLAYGVLSPREVQAALAEARQRWRGNSDWSGALRALAAQLRARTQAQDALPLMPPGDTPATGPWADGQTGLPFIDATMRALAATGWLDARSRALLAAVGVHHLALNPSAVGLHLSRLCTDYDPAIHWRALQSVALGRIPDPVAMGQRLDPQGAFIRRWVPELARVPDAHLHAPWLWPRARKLLAGRYPEPVVDPATAGRAARAERTPVPRPLVTPRKRAPKGQMALDL